jgi:hypothetical protein
VREERRVQRFVTRRPGAREARRQGERESRRLALREGRGLGEGFASGPWPHVEVPAWTADPEYRKQMEEWSRQMAEWGRKYGREYGKQWQQWGQKWGQQMAQRSARQAQRFALVRPAPVPRPVIAPLAPQAPGAPAAPMPSIDLQAFPNCDRGSTSTDTTLPDGRRQVIICSREFRGNVLSGLRRTRERIANDSALSEDTRRGVLEGLDQSIERLQRDGGE